MNKHFSLKLALNNIKNHRKFYLPYFLASVGIILMFYIMAFLAISPDIMEMSANLSVIMKMGVGIMAIFAFIFLFYTNSFLMKQRKKEIGLYNILGMEKRHIGKILFLENLMLSTASICAGILCGILFSKLVHLIISWIFGVKPPFGVSISGTALMGTVVFFGILFLLTLFANQMSIHLSKPIELLSGSQIGEKEPKSKWLLAIIGFMCLGGGYYIALTTEDPLSALLWFFVAVALVIVGTYCLFTAGSIAVLKALRKNKAIYYKPGNFTAISGMIYRMKQNAVGLANICILSTMVLVMVSGTVSLFFGTEEILDTMVPGDMNVTAYTEKADFRKGTGSIEKIMSESAEKSGVKIESFEKITHLPMVAVETQKGEYSFLKRDSTDSLSDVRGFDLVTAETYRDITGEDLQLAADEVAVDNRVGKLAKHFTLGGKAFTVKKEIDQYMESAELSQGLEKVCYLVVADDAVLEQCYRKQAAAYDDGKSWICHRIAVHLSGDEKTIETACAAMMDDIHKDNVLQSEGYEMLSTQSRASWEDSFRDFVSSFLFLGVFLGIVFTFAAALIIYYKQISEGYYDKGKFEIMQKVGMSRAETKGIIRRQVLMVFFLPLVMAGIHVAAAFKMITKLLLVFSMTNKGLFAACTLGTFLVFAVIYALVYMVTAREYYKIVG